jgi:hypothetical protein
MKINFLHKAFLALTFAVFVTSCDKDYNEIGTNIVGDNHFLFDKYNGTTVLAYNQNTGAVQTNNLALNTIGYYNHPVFGKTTASFVTQLELIVAEPKFYNPAEVVIDSVYLYVPYFSKLESTDSDTGNQTFILDSVYDASKRIKLSVYESGYYLRDFDPSTGLQERQNYYSNQFSDFDNAKIGNPLNDDVLQESQNVNFKFSDEEIKITYQKDGEQIVKERKTPGIWMNLNKEFFMNKIVNAPSGMLINNNTFKEYFRGLFFKVEPNANFPDSGAMAMLNFAQGKITMVYHDETSSTNTVRVRRALALNLAGNTVNVFQNQYNSTFTNAINNPNITQGDQKLYLKGQEGSMNVIELFGSTDVVKYNSETGELENGSNSIPDEIDQIKYNKWLINEANLTFYVDKDAMANSIEPDRIYLYDLQNRRPILDYYRDTSIISSNPKLNKYIHGGILEKENVTGGRGIKYKIRVTDHIKNIIKNDSTNVKLGLVVTEIITNVSNNKLKTPINARLDRVPVSSIINNTGTVLYGSNINVADDKRLKLEIYYTKPD